MANFTQPTSGLTSGVSTGALGNWYALNGLLDMFDTTVTPTTNGDVLISNGTGFDNRALLSTDNPSVVVNTRTTSYTAVASDAGKLIETNVGTANTLTFPSATFVAGNVVNIRQYGAGTTTVVGSGVTIRSRGNLVALAGPYAEATLTFRSATEAVLSGDLA